MKVHEGAAAKIRAWPRSGPCANCQAIERFAIASAPPLDGDVAREDAGEGVLHPAVGALTVDRPYTAWYRFPTSVPSAKEWLSKKLSPAFWTASTPGAACSRAGRPLTPESGSSADAMAAGIASSMPPASRAPPSADLVARVLFLAMEGTPR